MFHVKHLRMTDRLVDNVSRETSLRLEAFSVLLLRWNRTINLISKADEPQLRIRHIGDSLALIPALPPMFSNAIDLGSGAGFPGLVLAIATGRPFALVEADQRKAAFLREAARVTQAPVTVLAQRIETLKIVRSPVLTARALAPLSVLLPWIAALITADGVAILPKGRTAEAELTQVAGEWQMRVERFPSTNAGSTILKLSEITRVGRAP